LADATARSTQEGLNSESITNNGFQQKIHLNKVHLLKTLLLFLAFAAVTSAKIAQRLRSHF